MEEKEFLKQTEKGVLFEVKVTPSSSKNEFLKTETGFKARVQCAPEDGKANDALIKLISKEFGMQKRDVEIIKGKTSRNKVVLLHNGKI